MDFLERQRILIGDENVEQLKQQHIAVFGVGGVGSFVVESLVRAGIGTLTLIDFDRVECSNINRQIQSHSQNIGKFKVDEIAKRAQRINPAIELKPIIKQYDQTTHEEIFNKEWDYIVDAIDMVSSKLLLVEQAKQHEIPIISSMGTGNKLDPTQFEIEDIYNTSMCPLARVMRRELRDRKIESLKVLYSRERPRNFSNNMKLKGTISFVPPAAGLIIASEVITDLITLEEYYANE